jgi:hypothetical protein
MNKISTSITIGEYTYLGNKLSHEPDSNGAIMARGV